MLLDIQERMKRIPFFPLLWFVLTFFPFSALAWTGSVVSVSDGDTITVAIDHDRKTSLVVRLYGIDAPEAAQPHGPESSDYLRALLPTGASVDILPFGMDRYGRTVALVRHNGMVINGLMIKAGLAWVYPQYCRARFCRSWRKAQKAARAASAGLWRDENPTPPWVWRKNEKTR